MATNKKLIKNHLKSTLWIAVLGFPTGFLFCIPCLSSVEGILRIGVYSSFLWVIMWKGNEAVSDFLDWKLDWAKEPSRRLFSGILGHLVYTVFAIFVLNYTVYLISGLNQEILTVQGMIQFSIPAVIITYLITTFLTARAFFFAWRQSAVNEEKLKREIITTKFESLKNQVNPHFLFNSLNVLTSLVYKDPDLSAKFIKKLSNVYRYVLEAGEIELVEIQKELDFLQSYTFLLKMRHKEGLQLRINIPDNEDFKVAPLALQMLVENAVKHNVVSLQEPLIIDIICENGYLIVRNNLQKKEIKKKSTPEVGLTNIKERYTYFSNKPVLVHASDGYFEVKLPVLNF